MPKIIPLYLNGENLLKKFIKDLIKKHPGQQQTYVEPLRQVLREFELKGPFINKYHKNFIPFKKIEGKKYDDIYEIRTKKCRYFLYKDDPNTYIGLHGFEKKSNETPKHELEKARNEVSLWKKTRN